jgi:hypothetical protein
MNFNAWIEAERGRATTIAQHFHVTAAAVSQWKTNGVPVSNMKTIVELTDGEVTLDDMVPEPAKAA